MRKSNAFVTLAGAFVVQAVILIAIVASSPVRAQTEAALREGDLDPMFGNGGIVTTTIPGAVTKLIWRGDDKIVAMGHGERVAYYQSVHGYQDYVVARFNPDGSQDDTFGNGGAITPTPSLSLTVNSATAQPDGKVLFAGWVPTGTRPLENGYFVPNSASAALVRYNIDGTLDTSFGAGGVVTREYVSDYGAVIVSHFRAAFVQADSSILVWHTGFFESGLTSTRIPDCFNCQPMAESSHHRHYIGTIDKHLEAACLAICWLNRTTVFLSWKATY